MVEIYPKITCGDLKVSNSSNIFPAIAHKDAEGWKNFEEAFLINLQT